MKAINVPDDIFVIFGLSRSEICLKGAHFMSLWPHVLPPLLDTAICTSSLLYINKTLSQKTTGHRCSQPFGVVGRRFWYQVKAINVPDDIFTISCNSRSEICLKGAHLQAQAEAIEGYYLPRISCTKFKFAKWQQLLIF